MRAVTPLSPSPPLSPPRSPTHLHVEITCLILLKQHAQHVPVAEGPLDRVSEQRDELGIREGRGDAAGHQGGMHVV